MLGLTTTKKATAAQLSSIISLGVTSIKVITKVQEAYNKAIALKDITIDGVTATNERMDKALTAAEAKVEEQRATLQLLYEVIAKLKHEVDGETYVPERRKGAIDLEHLWDGVVENHKSLTLSNKERETLKTEYAVLTTRPLPHSYDPLRSRENTVLRIKELEDLLWPMGVTQG